MRSYIRFASLRSTQHGWTDRSLSVANMTGTQTAVSYSLEKDDCCQLAFNDVPVVRMGLALVIFAVHNTAQDGETLQRTENGMGLGVLTRRRLTSALMFLFPHAATAALNASEVVAVR